MSDEVKEAFDKDWTWLVSSYQGGAIALKANVKLEGDQYKMAALPDEIEYCKFTNITFRPPDNFATIPWPVEAFGLITERGWVRKDQLPFLRQPSSDLVKALDDVWNPKQEDAKPVTQDTNVDAALREARVKTELAKQLRKGPQGILR